MGFACWKKMAGINYAGKKYGIPEFSKQVGANKFPLKHIPSQWIT
jgi:hypothetical protein